jgi:hypothetical protein
MCTIILQAAVVPAIHGKWEVIDVPTPHPSANQVLIKIHASGLCYTDVQITEGSLTTAAFPRTIGHEPVGEIEVGDGVTKRKVGDRVGVPWYHLHLHVEDVNGVGVAKKCSVTSPSLPVSRLLAVMQSMWLLMAMQQLCYQMIYRMNKLLLSSALATLF